MSALKPYLIRAIYEWINDNSLTPYLLVNARAENVVVPAQFVQDDGRIVLNLRPQAIQALDMSNDYIEFSARFSGTPMRVSIPVRAVLAIYALENGRGMMFDDEHDHDDEPTPPPEKATEKPPEKKRPSLKVVK